LKSVKVQQPQVGLRFKRVRVAGNIIDVKEYEHMNKDMPIRRLDEFYYVVVDSGEILPYDRSGSRAEGLWRLRTSMDGLRAILNANFSGSTSECWVTLTYRENMTDCKQLTRDRETFWKRLKRKHPEIPLEYVTIAEPQERGAWHLHEVWKRLDGQKLFIDQTELMTLWSHGGVNIKRLDKADNIGAYLTSYLLNLVTMDSEGNIKALNKGKRLNLYPPGMNFYRCSRGIFLPKWTNCMDEKTEAIVRIETPNYRQVIELRDDKLERVQTVLWTQYNTKRETG
jgi:hypothetical protein